MSRLRVISVWCASLFALHTGAADYPSKPIRLIVPFAPAATPVNVIARLNTEINAALSNTGLRQRLLHQGFDAASGSPADVASYLRTETDKWTRVVRTAKLRVD